jgi:hypothetical protein
MKQRTTNNNKNENMKMRKKLITALVLGACVSMQVFAQNIKEDKIAFALTVQGQSSVSTSASVANAGNFSQGPLYYKTVTKKMTQTDILKAIAYVLHKGAFNYYSSQASLQLVQGELGGFWNINDGLAQSYEDFSQYFPLTASLPMNELTGSFNDNGTDDNFYDSGTGWILLDDNGDSFGPGTSSSGLAADYPIYFPLVYTDTQLAGSGPIDDLSTYLDLNYRTSIADGINEYTRLDTGRHFLPVPWIDYTDETFLPTTGQYPPGHMQPWGQIYVKDPGHKDSDGNPLCENVTFFFYLAVQECYDCFYLNSFISDATFKTQTGNQNGLPPCCSSPSFLLGKGVDKYYLSLSFDNTINNSFLNPCLYTNRDTQGAIVDIEYYYEYSGYPGLKPTVGVADGATPDLLAYSDRIQSHLGSASPYEMRFTLNGIVTYNWQLKMVNSGDVAADFVGTATYAANGYGFIGLVCQLITGSATFSEKIVKDIGCCDDVVWNQATLNSVANGEANDFTHITGWYGPGSDDLTGYYNPYSDPDENYVTYYNFYPTDAYPFYNIIAGWSYTGNGTLDGVTPIVPVYYWDLPYQNESPFNPPAALTQHGILNPSQTSH